VLSEKDIKPKVRYLDNIEVHFYDIRSMEKNVRSQEDKRSGMGKLPAKSLNNLLFYIIQGVREYLKSSDIPQCIPAVLNTGNFYYGNKNLCLY